MTCPRMNFRFSISFSSIGYFLKIQVYHYIFSFNICQNKIVYDYQIKNTNFFDKSFDDGFWYWNNGFILIEAARNVALLIKEV